jgi:hypothetical protein
MDKNKSAGWYLGLFAKIVLGVAMLLYLGLHSYNFFTFTFKGDQWIFSILGLFTTSIGFLLWLAVYLYAAEDGLEKAISIVMLFLSLMGEFVVAGFDMYMNISDAMSQMVWTPEDLRNMSYAIAGLALANGLALVAGIAGQQIMDDLSNVKFPSLKRNPKGNINTPDTSQPGAPDDYGPKWNNSTDITATLDAYAWECQSCQGGNAPHTRACQWCGQSRTNGSPVTAFSNKPPTNSVKTNGQTPDPTNQPRR